MVPKQLIERLIAWHRCSDGDVGRDAGSPVSPDYGPKDNEFSGEINWVQIDLEKDDQDHLITTEERFKVAMARQ